MTVPIVAVFGLWLFRTGTKYAHLGLEYSSLNNEVSLLRLAEFEGEMLARDLEFGLKMKSSQPARKLRPIKLYIPGASEAALNADLPFSGREYVPGSLISASGDPQEVKLRYRGDHYWHWAGRKKSLRVKTKKSQLFRGMRSFNLIAPKLPEQFSGHLSYFLARQLDLIAPEAEMVDLYVNGSYRGNHLMLEQLEEMVVRNHGRMPGDVYAADIVRDESYRGLPSSVFKNAGLWEKIAVNNHFAEDSSEPIDALIRVLAMPVSEARSLALRELIDIEAFGRFAAFRILCQSEHYDNVHNWRLYYDPWRNRFEPIVWDPVGWAIPWRPKPNRRARPDIVSSILDTALMQDHAFLSARQRAVEGYFAAGKDAVLLAELDRVRDQIKPSLATDPGLAEKLNSITEFEATRAIKIYRYFVQLIFDQVREDYLSDSELTVTEGKKGPGSVRIAIDGRRPLFGLHIALASIPDFPLGATLRFQDASGAVQRRDISGSLSQSGGTLDFDLFLSSQLEPDPNGVVSPGTSSPLRPLRGVYEIVLRPMGGENHAVPNIQSVSGRYAAGEYVRGQAREMIAPAAFTQVALVTLDQPTSMPQIWEGTRVCSGVERITDDVIILPGTTLSMESGASVIFEGHVFAEGTAENPIQVLPQDPDGAPWGTLAIRGPGANGSQFAHAKFTGGSGLKQLLAEYSAMFSIHNVADVQVSSCTFRDSKIVDDMVHAVYSSIAFDRCGFQGAPFDALDIDITEATVTSCSFMDNGNDSLDLMTSNVVAKDIWITRSGDKGVSVGEDTDFMMVNSSITECLIGVEMKDRSKAVIYNCEVAQNQTGLNAYRKNWRYGSGGFGFVYKSRLRENGATVTADRHSMIRIHDSALDPIVPTGKSIVVDRFSEEGAARTAKYPEVIRFPDEEAASIPLFNRVWRTVDPSVRGLKPIQ